MERALKDIKLILMVIMACAVIQTTWFLGEKVLSPAAAVAALSITDVNIERIGGYPIKNGNVPAIKVKEVK